MNGYNFSDASDIRLGSSTITALYYGSTLIWPTGPTPPTPTDWSTEYLQVEALEPLNLTTNMRATKTTSDVLDVQYSVDKTNWYDWNENISISMNTGDIVYFKGSYIYNSQYQTLGNYNYLVTSLNRFKVKGNIMSLVYGDNFGGQTSLAVYTYCFIRLFCNSGITDASDLIMPAITVSGYAYSRMFSGCTSLTTAPSLSATTLNVHCYDGMFSGCTSLTTAPSLSANSCSQSCYAYMFSGCTSLTSAPSLPATHLATYCYERMFNNCTSLTSAPSLPANSCPQSCYSYMFSGCTSLTTAPSLPATYLNYDCYAGMFIGCTSLTTAPSLPATTLTQGCYQGMFANCTSLTTAPELNAINVPNYCYYGMFTGCSSLTYIKCLSNPWNSNAVKAEQGVGEGWVSGVNSSGTFVKDANSNIPTGKSGIPSGWTVQNI